MDPHLREGAMKLLFCATAFAGLALAAPALAEIYDDYTPVKGAWEVQTIHVDPNHIDDYLTGLKTTWITAEEISKKHGIIDDYRVMVKLNSGGGDANVLLVQHYPNLSVLEPDRARDKAIEAENYAAVSKEKGKEMVAGYEKYRTFVSDEIYTDVTFPK
jgi:hypothetical protein